MNSGADIHPDYEVQIHGGSDRRRGSKAFSAPPSPSDPVSPAGRGGKGFPPVTFPPHSDHPEQGLSPVEGPCRRALFWLAAPLIAIAGLIALEIAYQRQEAEHEPY